MKTIVQFASCRTRRCINTTTKYLRKQHNIDLEAYNYLAMAYPCLAELEAAINSCFTYKFGYRESISAVLIELCTTNYITRVKEYGSLDECSVKLEQEQFNQYIASLLSKIPDDLPVIWISAHNVRLSDEHYTQICQDIDSNNVKTGGWLAHAPQLGEIRESKFIDQQFIARVQAEQWLKNSLEHCPRSVYIKTSDCFRDKDSSFCFKKSGNNTVDTYHYTGQAISLLGEYIYPQIKNFFIS